MAVRCSAGFSRGQQPKPTTKTAPRHLPGLLPPRGCAIRPSASSRSGFAANLTSSLLCRLDHSTARYRCLAANVCTGHGECYKDACVCAEGYHGDLCDCRVRNIGAVAGVTASTAVFFGLLFLSAARCHRTPAR